MNIEHDYLKLLKDILDNGREKGDRTGTGTVSVFGRQIRHDMSKGFPLLTTKKMYWKGIVTELLWFLRGDTNIKYLVDNNCHIWDGDAYKNWKSKGRDFWEEQVDGMFTSELGEEEVERISKEWFINKIKTDDEFAKKWGELGPVYGKQWRSWELPNYSIEHVEYGYDNNLYIDQIANLINDLKTNPDSRRLMVSAWNVGELNQMVLPPCHYGFQVYTRELTPWERMKISKDYGNTNSIEANWDVSEGLIDNMCDKWGVPTRAISLMFNMRSNDVPLGLPFNIASYALLLEIFGKMVNMIPDELIVNIGDGHIYKNQIDGVKEQITREAYPLPKLVISDDVNFTSTIDEFLSSCSISDFKIEDYKSHPTIKMPLSN